ncbi:MAG: hypothetical protein LBQ37_02450 [Elusimicrobiota bacterium]|jgi:hypothetical protein|nr:hypothetical protein [Elusimicrobiota bacterium]
MAEDAGSVYASLILRTDELSKQIVDAQLKINSFGKKIQKDTKTVGDNLGKGMAVGFDVAGKGAVRFGKTLAHSFGPVFLAITIVNSLVSGLKSLFSDAAKETLGFASSVSQLSSFFKDKLLVVIKPVVEMVGALLDGIMTLLTQTTRAEREATRIATGLSSARIEAQKKYGETLDIISDKEQKGAITAKEALDQRIAATKELTDLMIEGGAATNKSLDEELKRIDAATQARIGQLETAAKYFEEEGVAFDLELARQNETQKGEKEKADLIKKTTEALQENNKEIDLAVKKTGELTKASERDEKAKEKENERKQLLKSLNEKIFDIELQTKKITEDQNVESNKSLSLKDKEIQKLETAKRIELERIDNQYKSIGITDKARADVDRLKEATVKFYDAQKDGVKANEKGLKDWQVSLGKFTQYSQQVSSSIISIFETMAEVNRQNVEAQKELIDEMLEKDRERIEEQRQRALEEAGFAEAQRMETFDAQIASAREAGDEILAYQTSRRKQEKQINDQYDAQIKAAEKKAAKEKSDIEYKAAMEEWKLKIVQAINNMALAISMTLASAPLPIALPLSIAAAAAGLVQINALQSNPPKPPAYETGGIVPGSQYSGDRVHALVNSGELILNRAQQDSVAQQLTGGMAQPIYITVVAQLDGREITRVVAETAGNGIVTIPLRGIG